MIHWLMVGFVAVLFVALTPGVLLRLPPGGSKLVVAATHGLVFALVYHFTHAAAWSVLYGGKEGMEHHCKDGEHWDKDAKKCVKK
jgi:mannose/fructose/N-acetylgalactosamine-specific phosphotransferase system component IIC|uniref:Uncharacterized protein n=1 Tax=viral metagenome TaxID=1070528 RepID=A0A6C0B6V9_9ZZZZ